jgi:hypothetical protein
MDSTVSETGVKESSLRVSGMSSTEGSGNENSGAQWFRKEQLDKTQTL